MDIKAYLIKKFGITERGAVICELTAQGLSTHTISRRIGKSRKTVKWHLYKAYKKLPGKSQFLKGLFVKN